jgi:hypothetical protein
MMQIRKVSETAETITLGWDPVPGADGYRFYSAGVLRSKTMDPNRKTVKFSKGQEPYKIEAVVLTPIDSGTYPATDPEPTRRYAPRTHNVGTSGQDPRFCMKPEFGVRWDSSRNLFVDEMDATYNERGMLNSGRDRNRIVPELKGAESMDGLENCDPYLGPAGVWVGGEHGYPSGSYLP